MSAAGSQQTSPAGGFVMVPNWLMAMKPSANAVLAYVTLASFGTYRNGAYVECRPGKKTMSDRAGCSEPTFRRAVKELMDLGVAVRIERRHPNGTSAPSVYRLLCPISPQAGRPVGAGLEGVTGDPLGSHGRPPTESPVTGEGVTGDMGRGSRVTTNQEPLDQEPKTNTSPLPPEDRSAPSPREPRPEEGRKLDNEEDGQPVQPPTPDDALVEEIRTIRPHWGRRSILKAIAEARADGRPEQLIRSALLTISRDPITRVPGRLNLDGDWWATGADVDEEARREFARACKQLPPCEHNEPGGHEVHPATGWMPCTAERLRRGPTARTTPRPDHGFFNGDPLPSPFLTEPPPFPHSTADKRMADALRLAAHFQALDNQPDRPQLPASHPTP